MYLPDRDELIAARETSDALDRLRLVWRCILFTLLVLGLIAAGTRLASAQHVDRPTIVLEGISNTIGLVEITETEACKQQFTCVEKNPLMPDGVGPWSTAGRAAIKGAGNAVSAFFILKASTNPKYRKWARVASIGKIALNGWLAARAIDYNRR